MSVHSDLGKVPWRGPEVPVLEDGPDEQMPRDGLFIRVELLEMARSKDRDLYAGVLNRHHAGFAKILDQKVSESHDGFKMLLVWGEKYQSGAGFVPEESRPVVRSNEYANVALADDPDARVKMPVFGTPVPVEVPGIEPEKPVDKDRPVAAPVVLKSRELTVEGAK